MQNFSFPLPSLRNSRPISRRISGARRNYPGANAGGFTLVEMLVALAILTLMLTILFVPLRLGVDFTSLGTARADAQQAAQGTINRIATELRKSIFVYPNERMAVITKSSPYSNNLSTDAADPKVLGFPYYQETSSTGAGVCTGNMKAVDNTSRLDFILPLQQGDKLQVPVVSSRYIVSYYTRRQDNSQAWDSATNSYDGNINPIVLYRAQMPYLTNTNSIYKVNTTTVPNVDTTDARYKSATSCTSSPPSTTDRGSQWLTQNGGGEPRLGDVISSTLGAPASTEQADTPAASDARLTPLGVGLLAPLAGIDNITDTSKPIRSYKPETNFQCEDTNSDGKIDRVTINLALGLFDSRAAQNRPQAVRFSQVVDLPNVR